MRKEYNCVTGEVTEHEDAPYTLEVPLTYSELRAIELNKKTAGDQFDMLYWDKVNGTNTHGEWISSIKLAIPKT